MFKKNLYLRIVGTFISVVIISLFISYLINSLFFHREIFIEEEVTKITKGVAEIVEITQENKIPELLKT
ncbi:hypothetical protein [Alkalihalobacillus sp. BA299]|uniref:hypothetical protein n=1 Tax=Alkalihalobacillus sp. BA299 TaxID=2815938 RepID=UPI001ADAA2DB|nr:hypothetical protein [Alkalihalobacillus sp. BA299]